MTDESKFSYPPRVIDGGKGDFTKAYVEAVRNFLLALSYQRKTGHLGKFELSELETSFCDRLKRTYALLSFILLELPPLKQDSFESVEPMVPNLDSKIEANSGHSRAHLEGVRRKKVLYEGWRKLESVRRPYKTNRGRK